MKTIPDASQTNAIEPRTRFRQAFETHFDALNRYCLRRVPVDDVNDVVADVFVVAWRKVDEMPEEPYTLPWLYRVAGHQVSNTRRSVRRFTNLRARIGAQPERVDPGPEPVIVRNAELEQIANAVQLIGPKDREILLLRTHEELSYPEIAIALGCSPEAARKRSDRALRRLRKAADLPDSPDASSGTRAIDEGGDL